MNIVDICRLKYPGECEKGNITFMQPLNKILIGEWRVDGISRPDEDELLSEVPEYEYIFLMNQLQETAKRLIENRLNEEAQSKQYRDSVSCSSYVMSTNTIWKNEALTFISWRDEIYAVAINIFADVSNGAPIPSEEQFLSQLPVMVWPS